MNPVTNTCSPSSEADVLTRQVDSMYSGCLGAMEIMSSASDHQQQDLTRKRLILIPAREAALSTFAFSLKCCLECRESL